MALPPNNLTYLSLRVMITVLKVTMNLAESTAEQLIVGFMTKANCSLIANDRHQRLLYTPHVVGLILTLRSST